MIRNVTIGQFTERREAGNLLVQPEEPSVKWCVLQAAENRLGPRIDLPVALDQLHRSFELLPRYFREALRHVRMLEGDIIDTISRRLLPATDLAPTEVAVAIKNHQWFLRRRTDGRPRAHGYL